MTDEELNVKFEELKADIADKFADKLDILEQRLREMGFDPARVQIRSVVQVVSREDPKARGEACEAPILEHVARLVYLPEAAQGSLCHVLEDLLEEVALAE